MHDNTDPNLVSRTWMAPIEPPNLIPACADVVIIGGGIVGVSTAWFLARQGIDVVLCEKGHIAGEQSGRNWGWVRQQCRDARELPMMIESIRIWQALAGEIGEDVGYTQSGCIYAARNDNELKEYEAWLPTAKAFGLDTRLLSSEEVSEHIRGASIKWKGGIFTASDGRAEPHKAAPAIARAAERDGAKILTGCAVRGIETEAGRASAVVTEHGTIKASKILCAAGAWTSMFCRSLDINVPQLRVKGTVSRTEPGHDIMDGALWEHKTGIRRREDGGYTISNEGFLEHSITPSTLRHAIAFLPALKSEFGNLRLSFGRDFFKELGMSKKWPLDEPSLFEKVRVLNPDPNPKAVRRIRDNLDQLFPAMRDKKIVESWAGMIETTPDVIPIIDGSEKIPGFYIATGFSGHGFGIGPGAGKAIASMITGKNTEIDLVDFRLSRFYDGSKIELYKTV